MANIFKHDEYLVIQGTSPYTKDPVFWGEGIGFSYNGPFDKIGYCQNIPSHMEMIKKDLKRVKKEYPEFKPFIAHVTVKLITKKYRQKCQNSK